MAIEEMGKGTYVETEPVEEAPECVRFESDPGPAFREYLLPRLESARGSAAFAAREIIASLRAGRSLGDAVLDAIESLPKHQTKQLRAWVEEARTTRVYAYVEFPSMFRLSYGLMLTAGGPRDEVLDTSEVGDYEMENIAPYWGFHDALKAIWPTGARKRLFEEDPMVEVRSQGQYDEVLAVMGIEPDEGKWEKPGLYDFRDSPPTYSKTVEAHERESMKYEAEQALEIMFQDDEWRTVCETLLEKAR